MAASNASDIPEWTSKYCPCKGCGVAREEGRHEIVRLIKSLHRETNGPADDRTCSECCVDEYNYPQWPCDTIKALEGEQS